MTDTVIKAENLGKKYIIGHQAENGRYTALRDVLIQNLNNLWQKTKDLLKGRPIILGDRLEEVWALDDLSFEIRQGEAVGIIGRNGAGKTTLLRILSRITEPTRGRVSIKGRVASLLEVGTGFHPELTGRENIYLNGTILGMTRAEIRRKFDEIVAFAEIEKYLDTPVKRYSSGMYVRLAFAVAAHLEPEILLVDEVLAVGDAAFQKKCLGKMEDVAKEGRTVLFVSHNMIAVQSLCKRAICLNSGRIRKDGEVAKVVTDYLKASLEPGNLQEEIWDNIATAPGNDMVRLRGISVRSEDRRLCEQLTMKTPFLVEIEYWNLVQDSQLHVTLHLYTEQEIIAFTTGSGMEPIWSDIPMPAGLFRSTCYFPGDLLNSGWHRFAVLVVRDKSSVIYRYESSVCLYIRDFSERQVGWYGKEPGVVQPALTWSTEYLGETPTLQR
jgi:lipopolysaccharide transport system ATP-binding protein